MEASLFWKESSLSFSLGGGDTSHKLLYRPLSSDRRFRHFSSGCVVYVFVQPVKNKILKSHNIKVTPQTTISLVNFGFFRRSHKHSSPIHLFIQKIRIKCIPCMYQGWKSNGDGYMLAVRWRRQTSFKKWCLFHRSVTDAVLGNLIAR